MSSSNDASQSADGSLRHYRGVVKLGFSWMGEDVRPFTGPAELVKVLRQFLEGTPPDVVCLVQERVEDVVCEMRLICCRDLAKGQDVVQKELVRMRMHPPNVRLGDETFSLTSYMTYTAEEATSQAFRGDSQALQAAESEAKRLADLWLE